MNKYQKAFKTILEDLHPDGGLTTLKEVELIEELIDKETPMKPSKDTDDNVIWKYYCPNCGNRLNTLEKTRRCQGTTYFIPRHNEYGCGQKIDWSDEND